MRRAGIVASTSHASSEDQPPIINIATLDSTARAELASACVDWGLFHVRNHGISIRALAELERESQAFFAQSRETKRETLRSAENPWGYFDRELTKNQRDWKEIFDAGPATENGALTKPATPWPRNRPQFKSSLDAHASACHTLALYLLDAVAANLSIEASSWQQHFTEDHSSFLRLNHYPPLRRSEANAEPENLEVPLGISEHSDAGALTILLQDQQAGLQLMHEGKWKTITPVEGALTINIGDIVQVWSNDQYQAPLHRVLANQHAHRYTAAYFLNPSYAYNYQPAQTPARYRPINWGEFRSARSAGDYADYGEEVQIAHYRL